MTQRSINTIFFIIASCCLFFIDIVIFACMQQHQIDLLFCCIIVLSSHAWQKRFLAVPLLLLSMLSYLDTNIFGWALLYNIPTIILADYFDQHLHVKWIIPYLTLTAGLLLKLSLYACMGHVTISSIYATQIIVYNMICLIIFLKIYKYIAKTYTSQIK